VIDATKGEVALDGNAKDSIENLVSQYSNLFGPASAEACKEAVQDLLVELPKDQVPAILQ
jgi:hypothetical protein